MFGKPSLDKLPARGELGVTCWERPDAIQVLGQYKNRVDLIGPLSVDPAKSGAQEVNVGTLGEQRAALRSDDGEEVASAGNVGASVLPGWCFLCRVTLR